jgi:hypothetical protein
MARNRMNNQKQSTGLIEEQWKEKQRITWLASSSVSSSAWSSSKTSSIESDIISFCAMHKINQCVPSHASFNINVQAHITFIRNSIE